MKNSFQQYAVVGVVLVLLSGSIGYYSGTKHSSNNKVATADADLPQERGAAGFGGGNFPARSGSGGGLTMGEIVSVSGDTITLQLNDGTTKTVDITSSTTISKTVSGVSGDLVKGQSITVMGSSSSSGAVNATSIQIRPATETNTPPSF